MLERYQEWMATHGARVSFLFRALRSRNFLWYFLGNGVSLMGTWMQRMSISWLAYKLTGSAILLGAIDFASQFSAFLLMPFAGVVLDGVDLRRFLIITQGLGAIQALILGLLTVTGRIGFGHLVVMSIFLGLINAFDMPGRHALTVQLVEKREDLMNAIALNSSLFNSARLIGPAVAGIIVALVGEGVCFFLNALSFLPIIIALIAIAKVRQPRPAFRGPLIEGLKVGVFYAWGHPVIKPILILVSAVSFIGLSYIVLLPVVAKEILHGGPETLGFLMGANGLGALVGALYLASRKTTEGLEEKAPLAFGVFGIGVALFCRMRLPLLTGLMLVFNGFWMISGLSACNTILQTVVDEDKRARVMSLYTMAFMGMSPLGSLLQGYLSHRIGLEMTLSMTGSLCFASSAVYYLHRFGRLSEKGYIKQ